MTRFPQAGLVVLREPRSPYSYNAELEGNKYTKLYILRIVKLTQRSMFYQYGRGYSTLLYGYYFITINSVDSRDNNVHFW